MKKILIGIVAILAIILVSTSMYIVREGEYVSIRRFGKIIDTKSSAGLNFKVPFMDSKFVLPKKKIVYDLTASSVLTKDKKSMIIDNYVIWQINDPLQFIKSVGYTTEAEKRLDAAVYNAVKNIMGTFEQNNIIDEKLSGRGELNDAITKEVARQLENYGITVFDVQIKKLDLPPENEESVYRRMISEWEKIAGQYKAEGEREATKIRNEVDKQKNILISEAEARGQELIGEGEAEYIRILSDAYSGDKKEFYEFIMTLEAMKKSLKGDKTLVLPIDSPLTKYLIVTGE